MNTAQYRNLARDAESRLEWGQAADYWQLAIENYPNRYAKMGELQERDIKRMESRRDNCLHFYFPA